MADRLVANVVVRPFRDAASSHNNVALVVDQTFRLRHWSHRFQHHRRHHRRLRYRLHRRRLNQELLAFA